MKNLLIPPVILLLLLAFACNPVKKEKTTLKSTDTLYQHWVDAWNAQDIDAIASQFSPDGIVITDTALIGLDALKAGFIEPAAPMLGNLSCTKIYEAISSTLAFQSGSYKHDWIKDDSLVGHACGYYSIFWEKTENGLWKISSFQTN